VRVVRALVALGLLLGVACTSDAMVTSGPPHSPVPVPSVAPHGAATAAEAIAALCVPPDIGHPEQVTPGPLAPQIADVVHQVEVARGLRFLHQPAVDQISDAEMDRKLKESFDTYYPRELYDRRTVAWRTIGVIPPDADLRRAYKAFLTGQVIGFYDPETGELVYLGEGNDLSLSERVVLSHELTHALDDQHFDLKRLDTIQAKCADERFSAALGLVEGNAQHVSTQVVLSEPNLDPAEVADLNSQAAEAQAALRDVPPFVVALEYFSYTAGQAFVDALVQDGGIAAVDAAMRHLPVSTEQILHPEDYPSHRPTPVDVPDLTAVLGKGWGDLDAMTIGEEWLNEMLDLRLTPVLSANAAAGWDGGVYRAWTDGTDVVVVLQTAWDSDAEAQQFVEAMADWTAAEGNQPVAVRFAQGGVRIVFATSQATLKAAEAGLPD